MADFDKELYWANRKAGKRGQGENRMVYRVLSPEEYAAEKFRKKVIADYPDSYESVLKEAADDIRARANQLHRKDLRKENLYKAADIVEGKNESN